jgi:hypothetical protein
VVVLEKGGLMRGMNRRQFVSTAAGAVGCAIGLPAVALCSPATALPNWIDQRQQGPFLVRATFDLSPHRALIEELPLLELELRRVLALRPCSEPIGIELFRDKQQHREYLRQRFPATPWRRALFVKQDGRSTVFAFQDEQMGIDLRHECTHALLHADLAMVPLWLDEGLAEYFEMPPDQRAFGNPHGRALMWDLRFGLLEDIATLEAKRDLKDMTSSDYRSAWAWTHFLLHGPQQAAEQLWSFLGDIRRGEPPGQLSARLAGALPGAEKMLARHFRQWSRLATEQTHSAGAARPRSGVC